MNSSTCGLLRFKLHVILFAMSAHNFMRFAKKILLLLPALLIATLAHSETPKTLEVGVVLALTGPLSIQGVAFKNAMLLAKQELDSENRIRIHFEDDAFLTPNAVRAAKKLLEIDKVDVLIAFGTNQGLAIVDLTEKQKKLLLSINVNRAVVRGREHAFLLMPALETLTALNVEGVKRRKYLRVATAASNQDSCLLQQKILESAGVAPIVASETFDTTERDFRIVAARLVHSNPDAVFLSTLAPQGGLLAKSLRQLGYKGDFFGGIQTAYFSELAASGGALEGAWVASADDRHAEKYYESYRRQFGSEPTDLSMYAYDAIKLILKGTESPNLVEYLKNVRDFEGAAGRYNSDGNNGFTFDVAVKQFTANGYRYVD
ncbi:MAG: ABC transporter substrate-binding protein [Deltaproteobacteria bacterium]|nr:ABC transporter substrate-binding protein [Deltaproteobacteria bacterium]